MQVDKIFFSYSRADAKFALRLGEDLREAGMDIWIDQLDIPPGETWDEEIQKALENAACLLIILSKTSVESDNVLNEINYALETKKQVIPILIENDLRKPFNINRLQHIDFTVSYDSGRNFLLKALKTGRPVQPSIQKKRRTILPVLTGIGLLVIVSILVLILLKPAAVSPPVPAAEGEDSVKITGSATAHDSVKITGSATAAQIKKIKKSVSAVKVVKITKPVADISGKWKTSTLENEFDRYDKYIIEFNFDNTDVLFATAYQKSLEGYKNYKTKLNLAELKMTNGVITFHTEHEQINGPTKFFKNNYTGIIAGDSIRFTLSSTRFDFSPVKFVARRSSGN